MYLRTSGRFKSVEKLGPANRTSANDKKIRKSQISKVSHSRKVHNSNKLFMSANLWFAELDNCTFDKSTYMWHRRVVLTIDNPVTILLFHGMSVELVFHQCLQAVKGTVIHKDLFGLFFFLFCFICRH